MFRFGRGIVSMGSVEEPRYTVYVVLLDEYVGTLPQNDAPSPPHHQAEMQMSAMKMVMRSIIQKLTPTEKTHVGLSWSRLNT